MRQVGQSSDSSVALKLKKCTHMTTISFISYLLHLMHLYLELIELFLIFSKRDFLFERKGTLEAVAEVGVEELLVSD